MFLIVACVVSLIDDGKNPDEFTRDVFNSCIAKNQITKGKTDAFKVPMAYIVVGSVEKFAYELIEPIDMLYRVCSILGHNG